MWKALLLHICHLSIVGLFTMIHATCDLQPITGDDAQFCSDKFHVVYQGIGDVSCKHVPPCENYTQALSDAPALRYSNAEEDEVYTLIMVDPDAPSRQNPKFKNWRHWVLADIQHHGKVQRNQPRCQEENCGLAQAWFVLGYNFKIPEGASFICTNNYIQVQSRWECPAIIPLRKETGSVSQR
ncbi:phosphatidylethanolamine-binding protein 4 isoform X3 [Phyllobates terribilis]|uniref:phosphatidylethanolamine-binding protein 4 isoform X3 n=1 Tax=Phyllobates terribilis TaxID=111132 RepID=UPI003CCB7184